MSLELNSPILDCGDGIATISLHQNAKDLHFNQVIGCIEDMFVNDEFLSKQTNFMEKYWTYFEDTEENKLEYMDIFKEYQTEIEDYIEQYLKRCVPGFSMNLFIEELQNRRDHLNGEVFEVLFTLTDFLFFKEMLLNYKAMKEGRTVDFTNDVFITKIDTTKLV